MDEVLLIEQAKQGDITSYNRLVLHYQDAAYNFAYRIMGDPAAAGDATQDAFISAYKALNRYRQGNFKAWLFRIVNNKCYDALRKQKRHPESSIEEITEERDSPAFLADESDLPEDEIANSELMNAIQGCLMGLNEGQRAAVVLYDVEGYDYTEIAEILEISLGTVKSRLNRGRRQLQECLRAFKELLPDRYR